jgi:type II secretory pathway component PulM
MRRVWVAACRVRMNRLRGAEYGVQSFQRLCSQLSLRSLRARLEVSLPQFDLQVLSTLAARLSARERYFVGMAGIALGGLVFYWLLIEPLWDMHEQMRARVAAKERELGEVAALRRTYQTLRREADRVRATAGANVSVFALLEGLATSTIGRDKVASITPAGRETRDGLDQETIELTLSGVSLRELIEFLYKVDTAGTALRVVHLSVKKRYKDPFSFDVAVTTRALRAH